MTKHILVVDDVDLVANTKVLVIQNLGKGAYTAEAANGGKACLARLAKPPQVDLILLDMDMPEVNGADVIRTILKMEHPPAKILPMTAWGPDWVQHWGLTELAQTPAFKRWVFSNTYDKGSDATELMELIPKAMADPK